MYLVWDDKGDFVGAYEREIDITNGNIVPDIDADGTVNYRPSITDSWVNYKRQRVVKI